VLWVVSLPPAPAPAPAPPPPLFHRTFHFPHAVLQRVWRNRSHQSHHPLAAGLVWLPLHATLVATLTPSSPLPPPPTPRAQHLAVVLAPLGTLPPVPTGRDRDMFGAVARGLEVIRKQMGDLQAENTRLRKEVKELRAALEASGQSRH
jgi:hypothetical protein